MYRNVYRTQCFIHGTRLFFHRLSRHVLRLISNLNVNSWFMTSIMTVIGLSAMATVIPWGTSNMFKSFCLINETPATQVFQTIDLMCRWIRPTRGSICCPNSGNSQWHVGYISIRYRYDESTNHFIHVTLNIYVWFFHLKVICNASTWACSNRQQFVSSVGYSVTLK